MGVEWWGVFCFDDFWRLLTAARINMRVERKNVFFHRVSVLGGAHSAFSVQCPPSDVHSTALLEVCNEILRRVAFRKWGEDVGFC